MRRIGSAKSLTLAAALVTLMAPAATPAGAQRVPDESNAATQYARAAEKYRALPQGFRDEISFSLPELEIDCGPGPSLEARQALNRLRPILMLASNGARRTTCTFSIDRTDLARRGEFVADLRLLIRLVGYDFYARLYDEDVRGAIDHLTTVYRIASHASREGSLYGALAANAGLLRAETLFDRALDHAIIGPAEATRLLREIDRFDGTKAVDFVAAMSVEREVLGGMFDGRYTGETGLDQFRTDFGSLVAGDSIATTALQSMTQQKAGAMFAHYAAIAAATAEALANPDPVRRDKSVEAIAARIEASEFAPFKNVFAVANPNVIAANDTATRNILRGRRDLLANIASGAVDPMSLANAAVWRAKAARQARLIDPDKRRVIDGYAAKHDEAADHEVATILNRHDVQTVLRTLSEANAINRCDWVYAYAQYPRIYRWLHADMLWCGRLLVADAARLFHAQRYDDAAKRMAMAYRLSADIASDGTIGGSMAAHRIFSDIDALAEAAVDSGMLNEQQIAVIASGVRELSRGDPFHYQPAIARMRTSVASDMMWFMAGMFRESREYRKEEYEAAETLVADLSADRLLSIMALYAHWERAYWPMLKRSDLAVDSAGLEAIFDLQALRDTGDFAGSLTDWARSGTVTQVREFPFPPIAPVEERAKQSLSDYRAAVLRFERLHR